MLPAAKKQLRKAVRFLDDALLDVSRRNGPEAKPSRTATPRSPARTSCAAHASRTRQWATR